MSACGAVHHYRVYPSGTPISYSGSVQSPPAARWKVKLRVKLCRAGTFSDFARFDAQRRNRRTGTFSGTFTAPAAGAYSIRAVLYINGSATAQSAKRHFSTR